MVFEFVENWLKVKVKKTNRLLQFFNFMVMA